MDQHDNAATLLVILPTSALEPWSHDFEPLCSFPALLVGLQMLLPCPYLRYTFGSGNDQETQGGGRTKDGKTAVFFWIPVLVLLPSTRDDDVPGVLWILVR